MFVLPFFFGFGCGHEKGPALPAPIAGEISTDGIAIEEVPDDRPKFKRIYGVELDKGRSMKITIKTYYGGDRMGQGELDQPGGKWVLFDPTAIADKILDPFLVPLVQAKVNQILKIDKAFMDSHPTEFVDEAGVRWKREPK